MLRRLGFLWLLSAAALGGSGDPPGTVALTIEVGKTAPVAAAPGASVLCDDTSVVTSQFTADGNGYELLGLKPGSTLCGVWLAGQTPGGLYRVTVISKPH